MDEPLLSFGAQALRYFQRDHDDIRRAPIGGPAAWKGPALTQRSDWQFRIERGHIAELERGLATLGARKVTLETMRRDDLPLPTLAPIIEQWRRELMTGRGFVLVRGLPVEHWGDDAAAMIYWGLGLHLGTPGAQNPAGDLLGHVTDLGEESSQPHVRRYRTAGDIAFHCDLADAVGLLCLATARRGGASRIVSSVSVYNELLRRRPELIDRLYEPFYLDTRNEQGSGMPYVLVPPCRHTDGVLRTFYHSDYFRSVVRHPEVPRFTAEEKELIDLYEAIASSPDLYLDMQFEPGDVQLISNHFILHARTAYEDEPDATRKRHLLRLWLSL